jgi:hypothetical protein
MIMLTAILAIGCAALLVLWLVEKFGSWQSEHAAVSQATRSFRIALRYLARVQPSLPDYFAELFLKGDMRAIDRYFPDFAAFEAAEIKAELEGEYAE